MLSYVPTKKQEEQLIEHIISRSLVRKATITAIHQICSWNNRRAHPPNSALSVIHSLAMGILGNEILIRRLFANCAAIAVEEITSHRDHHTRVVVFIREIAIPHLDPRPDHHRNDPTLSALRSDIERTGGLRLVTFYHQLAHDFLALL